MSKQTLIKNHDSDHIVRNVLYIGQWVFRKQAKTLLKDVELRETEQD